MFMTEKLQVGGVRAGEGYEVMSMFPASKSKSKSKLSANLIMTIKNPALLGKIKVGDTFYVNFERADDHCEAGSSLAEHESSDSAGE